MGLTPVVTISRHYGGKAWWSCQLCKLIDPKGCGMADPEAVDTVARRHVSIFHPGHAVLEPVVSG